MRKLLSILAFTLGVALLVAAMLQRPGERILSHDHPLLSEEEEEGHRPDHPDEALQFRILQLQNERKEIPADGLLKGKAHLEVMKQALVDRARARGGNETDAMTVAGIQPGDWVSIGPGNIGGRIRAIVIDPGNANNIWVGSVSGGIWHTTNGGTSWAPVNDFLANLAISSLVIDPTNPSVMYAGTGEFFTAAVLEGQSVSPDGLRGLGVFKSTDAGLTWNQLAKTNPADLTVCGAGGFACPWSYVNRLAISPDGATMLAATGSLIWRSTDGGATWAPGHGVNGTWLDIDFHPTNSQMAIASTGSAALYTTDGGQNWTSSTFSPALGGGRVEVAYAPSSPSIVYASVNVNGGEIYRSNNGGQSFSRVQTGSNFLSQGNYANIIWVDPQNPDVVIVGGLDLWRSTNATTSNSINLTQISKWQCAPYTNSSCSGTSVHADQHMIVAAPGFDNTSNKRVYFSNDGGIYRTDDVLAVGQQNGWVNLNNQLGITQFYSGTAMADLTLIGGTQDNGTLRASPDSSLDPPYSSLGWTPPIGSGGDGAYVAADPADSHYAYLEYVYLTISRSVDGAATFSPVYTGIADAGIATKGPNFIAPFILDPSNANRMLAGGISLWQSNEIKTASAPFWSAIKPPLSDGLTPPSNVPISAIVIAPNNPDLIVVGHNGGQILLSSNGTSASPNWNRIDTAALPKRFVTHLAMDGTKSPNWIYVTFGGFSNDNIYVTKNLGTSWTDITGAGATGLPDVPVRSLLINRDVPNSLYAGTEVGLFTSDDAGAHWFLPQSGPANVSVDEVFQSGQYFVAATHGRGFFTTQNNFAVVTYMWDPATKSQNWLNSKNWGGNPGLFPGADNNSASLADGATTDWVEFDGFSTTVVGFINLAMGQINQTGLDNDTGANGALTLGVIIQRAFSNYPLTILNGSPNTLGYLTLTGRSVDGVDNTILVNESVQAFRLGGFGSGGSMGIVLGNPINNVIQVTNSGPVIISYEISGTGRQLEKTGAGPLQINATNIYSGGTVLTAGTITFLSSSCNIGSITAPLTINGGTFDMSGSNQTVGAFNGSGGTILNNGPGTNAGILTVGNGGATGSYGGVIADHASGTQLVQLVKTGTGTQTLTGVNTYTGGTTVNGGTLLVYNPSGSGTGTQTVSLAGNAGATFGGGSIDGSGGISGLLHIGGNSGTNPKNNLSPNSIGGDTAILRVGSLDAQGIFNIDIGGTTPGTSYDQVLATGTAAFIGSLRARFLGGFENSIQPTDVFDIIIAGSGTINKFIDNLNTAGRLNAFGTQGSFAVQLVNNGKTIRLTDFQHGAVTFDSWASAHSLSGANAATTADPDGDGLSNLQEYAFGHDPNAADGGALTQTQIVTVAGTNYLGLTYTRPSGANADTDITYTPQRTTDLAVQWSGADVVVQSITPGPGTLETVTVRSTHPLNTLTKEFLRISVSKP